MKITIVLGAFFPVPPIMGGAVEKIWFDLAQEIARRGHEVVQVSRAVPQLPAEEMIAGVRHVRIAGFNTPRSLWWLKLLDLVYSIRALRILPKSDVTVTNTFWLPVLLRNAYVHVARYPKGQMKLYGRAVRLQGPSQAVGSAISSEAPGLARKVRVIPYPAPTPNIADRPLLVSQRERIILYVGRVHPEKGVDLLVRAFADKARTVFANWRLMIVGPVETNLGGGGESYLSSLKSLGAGANVDFAGAVFDPVELEKKYRSAALFVYPSLAETGESFGLAPLEAMTHGCAVLVSNLECFHDFIQDRETGFVFDHRAGDPAKSLGDKLEKMVVDLAETSRVADAGYRKSAEYSLERIASQFISDFESVTQNPDA